MVTCIENSALALEEYIPPLPSLSRQGRGIESPSLDGRGRGRVASERSSIQLTIANETKPETLSVGGNYDRKECE